MVVIDDAIAKLQDELIATYHLSVSVAHLSK